MHPGRQQSHHKDSRPGAGCRRSGRDTRVDQYPTSLCSGGRKRTDEELSEQNLIVALPEPAKSRPSPGDPWPRSHRRSTEGGIGGVVLTHRARTVATLRESFGKGRRWKGEERVQGSVALSRSVERTDHSRRPRNPDLRVCLYKFTNPNGGL